MCDHYHPQSCDTPGLTESGFTRRRFLGHGLGLVSAATTVPAFLMRAGDALAADTTMRLSSKPGVPDDRVLVVVQLSGGNDGLNTVIPYGQDIYYKSRPTLGIKADQVLKVDGVDGLGLHPSLAPIQEMMQGGLACAVQGVGYPNPNRSHFSSMDIWHTADASAAGQGGRGWIGTALDSLEQPTGLDCLNIGKSAPLATLGKTSRPVSFENAQLFRWAGRDLDKQVSETYDQVHDTAVDSGSEDPLAFINRTSMDAQVASDKVRKATWAKSKTKWPGGNSLGRQLEMVAKMIRAELPTRVYYVALGGFDTHANQLNNHQRLMDQFAKAMKAFYDELEATGNRSRVVSLAFSEFGRRVRQNASAGTDHGCAGPSFVFGEHVNPGILGTHPSLTELEKGDLVFNTDFRSLYTDLLQDWMKMDAKLALGQDYPSAGILRAV
ncbi:DUF1501 domain-containing protein [Algisphaera agarilytica]|uniref:Uncharacterized protein (DUF1501 family) n=1 Tax=Algisphaera agarilytica TaxID=1385975 RepID=A0A7X0H8E3_9BACT|nr:DUF1501 domain-containing protein [Algisphaera agarilytica]MBB6430011.1 uncharacterized protein (DUF1501 family) [Algisphaera agarilytica]